MSVHALSFAVQMCSTCRVEYPLTTEYFRRTTLRGSPDGWRKKCRRCAHEQGQARERELVALAKEVEAAKPRAHFKPRIVSQNESEGGFTEHPVDGYRWFAFPDTHGRLADWQAVEGALALSRWYKPTRIILLGDHTDLEGLSRFDKPAEAVFQLGEDLDACDKFLGLVRESHPNVEIEYVPGNHEKRLIKWLWKHPEVTALFRGEGTLPKMLALAKNNIRWIESGVIRPNDKFMWKHGNIVRSKSGASARAELERNGVSGASGHTHRQALYYDTTMDGVGVWCESGCLCRLDPPYADEQTMNWQQGVSLGSVSLTGNGFTVHPIPIIKGRAKALGIDIGA